MSTSPRDALTGKKQRLLEACFESNCGGVMCEQPRRPLEALKTSSMRAPFSSDAASSDTRGILTHIAHLTAFTPRGAARGDLNQTTNVRSLRQASPGSDRPSCARKPRTTKRSGVENAIAGQDLHQDPSRSSNQQTSPVTNEATQTSPDNTPFFASERVPRRRGQTFR